MGRFITHDDDSSHYWSSRKMAMRHIRLWFRARGVVLDLYQELEFERYGPGRIIASGLDLI